MAMRIKTIDSIAGISPEDWNRLCEPDVYPFASHQFLSCLEANDCLAPQGWYPKYITVYEDNVLTGALPAYLKTNSIGEFVFDWAWAEAYHRLGRQYYPKLVCAIPFTPVTGARLLVPADHPDPGTVANNLIRGAVEFAQAFKLSSLHCLFPEQRESELWRSHDMMIRTGCQYHWFNHGYGDFADFLGALTSKKRKEIKRERRSAQEQRLAIEILHGENISDAVWKVFYGFYCSTFHRKWGAPRLTLAFFKSLARRLPAQTLLLLARREREYVAGAFAIRGSDTLFGRHWGCSETYRHLHFELCYYQTIEYCIEHGLRRLDAGAQGEHKLSRGFVPVETYSAHWIDDPRFKRAIRDFLDRETPLIKQHITALNAHSPYRNVDL